MDAIVAEIRADDKYRELDTKTSKRTNLTGGLLMETPGAVAPWAPTFVTRDPAATGEVELIAVFHLGNRVTGHEGIVHGGMLATLLDEYLCRCGFLALPHHVGVTAHLSIDYKKPTPADSIVILKATTPYPADGRKAWVQGSIYVAGSSEPTMEAKLLAVEPKWHEKLVPLEV